MVALEDDRDDDPAVDNSRISMIKATAEKHNRRQARSNNSLRAQHKAHVLKLCQETLTANKKSEKTVVAIKELYKSRVIPIETKYHLHSFTIPSLMPIQWCCCWVNILVARRHFFVVG
jgi:hypothetical protein